MLAVGCTGKAQFGVSNRLHWEGLIWHWQWVAQGMLGSALAVSHTGKA